MELNEGAEATATHWSTEIKDGHTEKHRQHFTCQPIPQSCTACYHEGSPQLWPLCRKRTAEDPKQPSWLSGTPKAFATKDLQSLPMLISAERAPQRSRQCWVPNHSDTGSAHEHPHPQWLGMRKMNVDGVQAKVLILLKGGAGQKDSLLNPQD